MQLAHYPLYSTNHKYSSEYLLQATIGGVSLQPFYFLQFVVFIFISNKDSIVISIESLYVVGGRLKRDE